MDYYEILGVAPHASQRQIKKVYRRLALRHHPDHNPNDPDAENRFKTIAAAYRVLSDPARRADHDRTRSSVASAPGGWTAPPRRPTSRSGPDVSSELGKDSFRSTVPLDFRDAYLGVLFSVSITLSTAATRHADGFLVILAVCVLSGLALSWPWMRLWDELSRRVSVASALQLPVKGAILLLAAGGAFVGSAIVIERTPSVFGGSGLPYAFFGGIGGGLLGAACGRIFTSVTGPLSGLAAGGFAGGSLGGLIGFFCWYWGAVFRFRYWPAGDETSLLALAGVGGALLGAAAAGGIGSAREA